MTIIHTQFLPRLEDCWNGGLGIDFDDVIKARASIEERGETVDKIVVSLPQGCYLFGVPLEIEMR